MLETDGMLCHYQILCGSAIVLRGFHKFKGFNEVSFESVLYSHLPSTVSKKNYRKTWLVEIILLLISVSRSPVTFDKSLPIIYLL